MYILLDIPVPSNPLIKGKEHQSQLGPPHLPIVHLRPLPQRFPLNLPRRTLRHLIHENHPARQILVFRNLTLDPFLYLSLARGSFGVEQDVGTGEFLGAEGVLDTDDARVGDGGMGEENGFEFGGSDLEAGDFDEFLLGKIGQRGFYEIYYSEDDSPSIDPQCKTIPSHR